MKSFRIWGLILLAFFMVSLSSEAQTKKKTKKKVVKKTSTTTGGNSANSSTAAAAAPTEKPAHRVPLDSVDYDPKTGYNYLSVMPVHASDIMYRMRVWRNIDLNEKCNTPFFNFDSEITKFILDAYRKGELMAFTNDSLTLERQRTEVEKSMSEIDPLDSNNNKYFKAKDLSFFEIKEDLMFDKQRSQTRYDILSLTMYVPADATTRGFDLLVASFRYKDVERILDARPEARWRNAYNNAEDRRFSDAFRLRLFCSRIIRISKDNPTNNPIASLSSVSAGGPKAELLAAQQFEYDLVSQENELYEY
ncbi:MAG: gliding motility protein GldN [Bacteroidota bacterium]